MSSVLNREGKEALARATAEGLKVVWVNRHVGGTSTYLAAEDEIPQAGDRDSMGNTIAKVSVHEIDAQSVEDLELLSQWWDGGVASLND